VVFCEIRVFFVVFGWLERGELLVICGELCGGFVARKTRQLFEINLWKRFLAYFVLASRGFSRSLLIRTMPRCGPRPR
jgi:hypothetical protein